MILKLVFVTLLQTLPKEIKILSVFQSPPLAHQVSAGRPCSNCRELCPGFELHFWRWVDDEFLVPQVHEMKSPQIVARVSRTVKFYVDFFSFCQDHRFPECVEIFFWVLKKKRFECYQCGCCCYIFYTCLPSFCELGLVFCLLLVALALRYEGNISLSSKSYQSTTIIWTSVKRSKKVEHFKAF